MTEFYLFVRRRCHQPGESGTQWTHRPQSAVLWCGLRSAPYNLPSGESYFQNSSDEIAKKYHLFVQEANDPLGA